MKCDYIEKWWVQGARCKWLWFMIHAIQGCFQIMSLGDVHPANGKWWMWQPGVILVEDLEDTAHILFGSFSGLDSRVKRLLGKELPDCWCLRCLARR